MLTNYINTKSPYVLFTEQTSFKYAVFQIYIYDGTQENDRSANPNYTLVSTTFDTKGNVEISPFIDSLIEQQFNGIYGTTGKWVDSRYYLTDDLAEVPTGTTTSFVSQYALPGYSYFEDGINFSDVSNGLLIDNEEIQISVGEGITVPIFTDVADRIILRNTDNVIVDEVDVTLLRGDEAENKIFYYQFVGPYPGELASIEIIPSTLLRPNRVLRIIEVNECKYTPLKITFLNRYGVLQDLWFFKRKDVTLSVKQEDYKRSLINIQGETYNKFNHQTQVYNKKANEEITLNSGFVPESFNVVFKEMILSERVWLTGDINGVDTIRPVNVTSSSFNYKYKLDEKLINHEVKLDFAFDTINNIA